MVFTRPWGFRAASCPRALGSVHRSTIDMNGIVFQTLAKVRAIGHAANSAATFLLATMAAQSASSDAQGHTMEGSYFMAQATMELVVPSGERRGSLPQRVVVALGGNALIRRGERGEFDQQWVNVDVAAGAIAALAALVPEVIVTHGNGPQVGFLALQSRQRSPPYRRLPSTSSEPSRRVRSDTCSARR